jgi:CRP-like cAMP-binding protein
VSARPDPRHLPLFRAFSEPQLATLLAEFTERRVRAGEVLFREGDLPSELVLLVEGEVELSEAREPKIRVRSPALLGELGAMTGTPRNTTAVAINDAVLLQAETSKLAALFARSSEVALVFYRSLLGVVGDKVRRDRARAEDMRANIVRTQKRMKELRDVVLAAPETPISQPVCEALDELIERNRRAHYRVTPLESHPASVRIDGRTVRVVELSEGYLKLDGAAALAVGTETSGVLVLPQREIPVSGKVARVGADGILVKLDLLIDEYQGALLGYVTQLQLLDIVA